MGLEQFDERDLGRAGLCFLEFEVVDDSRFRSSFLTMRILST